MRTVPVVEVTLDPYPSNGFALRIRSEGRTWRKLYGTREEAWSQAEDLEIVDRLERESESQFLIKVGHTTRRNAFVDPEELDRLRFGEGVNDSQEPPL
jgi:hypothetical protein